MEPGCNFRQLNQALQGLEHVIERSQLSFDGHDGGNEADRENRLVQQV